MKVVVKDSQVPSQDVFVVCYLLPSTDGTLVPQKTVFLKCETIYSPKKKKCETIWSAKMRTKL